MNKTFLLILTAIYLTSCQKDATPASLGHATVEYKTLISSVVTFYAYYSDQDEQFASYEGMPLTGSAWTQQFIAEETNFKDAKMTLYFQGTPPFQVTSQILINGVVKKSVNSTFKNYVDTLTLEVPNVWAN